MPPITQADMLWAEYEVVHGPPAADIVLTDEQIAAITQRVPAEPDGNEAARQERVVQALRLALYHQRVAALAPGPSALCLSGGGVRSAAFSLGVLQGLARRSLLSQFDYLSTVSGGGYIGAWLTAWAHRRALARPADPTADPDRTAFQDVEEEIARRPAFSPEEIGPIRWLRRNQRFITPRAGALSGDLWAALSLFLRDLLLNWLVFLPVIMAALLLPRLLEMQLAWWASFAHDAGSGLGWLAAIAEGHGAGLAPPRWQGWTDVAAMLAGLFAVRRLFRARLGTAPVTDRRFALRILAPLLGAGWLMTMFNTVILANGARPDGTLLALWLIGMPTTLVAARVLARREDDRDLAWDLGCLIGTGLTVGGLIWVLLRIRHQASWGHGTVRDLATLGEPALLLAFFAGQVIYAALACRAPFGRRDQEWAGRASGIYFRSAAIWAAAGGVVLYGEPLREQLLAVLALLGVSGSLTLGVAVSAVSKANAAIAAATQKVSVGVVVQAMAALFVLSGVVLLTQAGLWLLPAVGAITGLHGVGSADAIIGVLETVDDPAVRALLAAAAGRSMLSIGAAAAILLAISLAMSLLVDVNLFSLHALYRNRLIRSFLGASNLRTVTGADPVRDPFDGFAEADDVRMEALWRWPAAPSDPARKGPYPVINIALNLVSGPDPAWQDRKAAPFVATPHHLGGDLVGYMPHDAAFGRRNLSLGTAMAISGAAASPNWGYHSSPLVGFLMTLFNVRLGWWLENPQLVGQLRFSWRSFRLLLQEALGQTSATDPYLYLSDGGHFDNLGLYEMLRRRCRLILAVDATQDAEVRLDDLGRTLRQASIDFGVSVTFDTIPFSKRADPAKAGLYCTIGQISYPEGGPAGTLIYIKPGYLADAPADIRAFAAGDPKFPHDSTFNQWFTESQFESYRALGAHALGLICGPSWTAQGGLDLAHFPGQVRRYMQKKPLT